MRRSMMTLAAITLATALPLGMAMAAESGGMEQGSTPTGQQAQAATAQMADSYLASSWIGKELKNAQGEEVGRLHSMLVNKDGKITYGIVSQGGAFGMGGKSYAVPWDRFSVAQSGKLTLDVKKGQISSEFSAFEPSELKREHQMNQKQEPGNGMQPNGMQHESQ